MQYMYLRGIMGIKSLLNNSFLQWSNETCFPLEATVKVFDLKKKQLDICKAGKEYQMTAVNVQNTLEINRKQHFYGGKWHWGRFFSVSVLVEPDHIPTDRFSPTCQFSFLQVCIHSFFEGFREPWTASPLVHVRTQPQEVWTAHLPEVPRDPRCISQVLISE